MTAAQVSNEGADSLDFATGELEAEESQDPRAPARVH